MDTEDNVQMDWNTLSSLYQKNGAIAHKEILRMYWAFFMSIYLCEVFLHYIYKVHIFSKTRIVYYPFYQMIKYDRMAIPML